MNTTRDFVRTSFTSFGTSDAATRFSVTRAPLSPLTRAGLPVVGNRAFINSWMARRPKLTPLAQSRCN